MSEDKKVLKFSDDLIVVVREIIQLSLLTGTNLVDHFRAVQCEEDGGKLVPTKEYVAAYNDMVAKLNEEAMKQQEAAQTTVAVDHPDPEA